MGMKRIPIALILIAVVVIAACTRQAQSTNPDSQGAGGELPFPTPGGTSEFPAMDILSTAAAATLTAQAGGEQQATEVVPPTSEPAAATATPEPTAIPQATAVPPTEAVAACQSPYTVQQGEWVWSIARKCGLDPNEVIRVNGLVPPYLLYPGDKLQLPAAGQGNVAPTTGATCPSPYTVSLGEWVWSIANRCGVSPEAVIAANNLVFPYTIYPGNQLVIP